MDKPIDLVEFETMLLGRYTLNPHYPQETGMLDRSAYLLLSRLGAEGPMSVGQLSDAFGLNASTVIRQTAALLRDGLVERILDPEGGVARMFRITRKGQTRLDADRTAKVEGITDIMRDWSPEEVAAFAGYLRRFNGDIEERRGQPWPRPDTA